MTKEEILAKYNKALDDIQKAILLIGDAKMDAVKFVQTNPDDISDEIYAISSIDPIDIKQTIEEIVDENARG